jgi:hypothetical protein
MVVAAKSMAQRVQRTRPMRVLDGESSSISAPVPVLPSIGFSS